MPASLTGKRVIIAGGAGGVGRAVASAMQPFTPEERARQREAFRLLPPEEVAEAILFAATRSKGVDVVTLRIGPLDQKIW